MFFGTLYLGQVPHQSPSHSIQSIRIEFLSVTTHHGKWFASLPITSHFLCGDIESLDDIFTRRGCLCASKFLNRSYLNACFLAYTRLFRLSTVSRGFSPSFGFLFSLAFTLSPFFSCFISILLHYTLWFRSQLTFSSFFSGICCPCFNHFDYHSSHETLHITLIHSFGSLSFSRTGLVAYVSIILTVTTVLQNQI